MVHSTRTFERTPHCAQFLRVHGQSHARTLLTLLRLYSTYAFVLYRSEISYLAASVEAAASFALRGDGRGTTVWGRSAFGDGRNLTTPPVCAKILPVRASPPQRFRYRLVAKCRLLTGKEVKVRDEIKARDFVNESIRCIAVEVT